MPRAKIVMPEVPPRSVSRPRLLSALDRTQDAAVALVSAPAGSGKTVLLAEWVRLRHLDDTAWVTLDSDDNDDRRFWSGILTALERCPAVPLENPVRYLAVPAAPSRHPGFTGAVINALAELPAPVWLVLDDVHEIVDDGPLKGLETLFRLRPPTLRLMVSTRNDPPLPLAKLRLDDRLTEIRAGDLRFSESEARALLSSGGVELDADQLTTLVNRTEGWAAGLRLATVSLRDAEDPGRLLAQFAGNDRAMADYLLDEVLSRLSPEQLEFLRAVSVVDEVSAGLAGVISGRADAGTVLDHLERTTSLVMPVGTSRQWYRVHALVRSYLLADLSRQFSDKAAVLHQHAAGWFVEHGRPAQALTQLIHTRDADRVVASLRRLALPLALAGEYDLLARALTVVGEDVVAADSSLALVSALLHLEEGEAGSAVVELARAEAAWALPTPAELEQLRTLVKARIAELNGDAVDMRRTAEDLQDGEAHDSLDALRMLRRGTALVAAGQSGTAEEELTAALEIAQRNHQDYVAMQCRGMLSGVAAIRGDYRSMGCFAEQALHEAEDKNWQHTMAAATSAAMLGYRELLLGHLDQCRRQTAYATPLVDGGPPACRGLSALLDVLDGSARFEAGEWAEGLAQLAEARANARRGGRLAAGHVVLSGLLEHRAALRFGWLDYARQTADWVQAEVPGCGELALMRAKAQFAVGRAKAADALLRPLLSAFHTLLVPWAGIDAWLLDVEISLARDDDSGARRALHSALSLAEQMDALYPLVFASPIVTSLVVERLGKLGGAQRIADRVLDTQRTQQIPLIPVPLTHRERTVLSLMPTMRSYEEIAQDLTISSNTVKTHVRAVYQKLGVRRRRDAVNVAVARGLLQGMSEVTNDPGKG